MDMRGLPMIDDGLALAGGNDVSKMTLSLLDLPTELLIEIFSQSNSPYLPIVCCHFRDIIYSTPSFWSHIYIGEKQYTPEAISFLSTHLERGVACPLDVVIRDVEPTYTPRLNMWLKISTHRDRIRTLDIGTDTVLLCGRILHTVLLTPPMPPTLPSLRKLDIRHEEDLDVPFNRDPTFPQFLLYLMPSLFPALTTLVLPLLAPCIPYPDFPIPSLKTLVLDGSMSWLCDYPSLYQITQLLAQTPQLETLWCKEHRVHTHQNLSNLNTLPPDLFGSLPVNLPVLLPRLTKLAVVVPGIGIDLLHVIEAPALQDLHLDGTRADEEFGDEVAWLDWFPEQLHGGLQITSSRSPALRRLSLLGAYLPRHTWEWLLGCREVHDVPFPLLEVIAVREMEAVKWQVTNAVDDALVELYAKQGHLVLRRFAYLTSEPHLRGAALHQLITGIMNKHAEDQIFELELDGIDTKERLDSLLPKGVILHKEPPQIKAWWTLGKDIDATEGDSY